MKARLVGREKKGMELGEGELLRKEGEGGGM